MSDAIIDVVAAVIVRDGRILLTQRRADKDFSFQWESPGGKVDPGETHAQALKRELREELGVDVEVRAEIWSGAFHRDYLKREDRRDVRLIFYYATIDSDQDPRPLENQGLGWFTNDEMAKLSLAPANSRALYVIRDVVQATVSSDAKQPSFADLEHQVAREALRAFDKRTVEEKAAQKIENERLANFLMALKAWGAASESDRTDVRLLIANETPHSAAFRSREIIAAHEAAIALLKYAVRVKS